MKIVLTGSAGNITTPLAQELLAQGHQVTVIGRSAENLKLLTDQGAKAAVGSLEDGAFLVEAFKEADAVYTMVPAPFHLTDWVAYHQVVAENYVEAILANQVKKVVNLSTYGAHRLDNISIFASLGLAETILNQVKVSTTLIHLRAGYFYNNLTRPTVFTKNPLVLGGNYGSSDKVLLLVHVNDIAQVVFEALTDEQFPSDEPYYIVSDTRTPIEVASVLGKAINQDGLNWTPFSDDDFRTRLTGIGFPDGLMESYLQVGHGLAAGTYNEHYLSLSAKPKLGKIKLEEYAKEFANFYHQQ